MVCLFWRFKCWLQTSNFTKTCDIKLIFIWLSKLISSVKCYRSRLVLNPSDEEWSHSLILILATSVILVTSIIKHSRRKGGIFFSFWGSVNLFVPTFDHFTHFQRKYIPLTRKCGNGNTTFYINVILTIFKKYIKF